MKRVGAPWPRGPLARPLGGLPWNPPWVGSLGALGPCALGPCALALAPPWVPGCPAPLGPWSLSGSPMSHWLNGLGPLFPNHPINVVVLVAAWLKAQAVGAVHAGVLLCSVDIKR